MLTNVESSGIRRRAYFPGSRWHGEVERRAVPAVAVGPNRPPCDSTIDLPMGQAHAAALRLRRKERVEYLVTLPRDSPDPVS